MGDYLAIDAANVRAQIERLKVSYPELTEDAELLASAVEGETDFERVMGRVTECFLDAIEFKEAIAGRLTDLKARSDRYDRKAEAIKALAFGLMSAAGQRTIRLPEATLSIAMGRKRLVIDDDGQLPQGFIRLERVPLKTEIAAALNVGEHVPGAHLEAPEQHLSIRTK